MLYIVFKSEPCTRDSDLETSKLESGLRPLSCPIVTALRSRLLCTVAGIIEKFDNFYEYETKLEIVSDPNLGPIQSTVDTWKTRALSRYCPFQDP